MKTIELTAQDLEFTEPDMPCTANGFDCTFEYVARTGAIVSYSGNMKDVVSEKITATESDYLNHTIGKVVKTIAMGNYSDLKCSTIGTRGHKQLMFSWVEPCWPQGEPGVQTATRHHPRLAQIISDKTYRFVDGKAVEG